jgi:hypothetical protein
LERITVDRLIGYGGSVLNSVAIDRDLVVVVCGPCTNFRTKWP